MSLPNYDQTVHHMRVVHYDDNHVRQRPTTGPAIVLNKSGKSPYINNTTNTWWTYDDEQKLYVDTHVFAYPEINIDSDQDWNLQAVNSAGVKDTYKLESLSIEEIDAICQ